MSRFRSFFAPSSRWTVPAIGPGFRARAGGAGILLLLLALTARGQAPAALTIVRAAPNATLAQLTEANEIRIVFSEPMIALGRVPQPVTAPFVRIEPALKGSYHWSGTTILIFTPDRTDPPAYATSYTVTVDRSARAQSGRQLAAPYVFRFTTPPVRMLTLAEGRVDDRFDRPALLYLRFNQPVSPDAVLPHIHVRYDAYTWQPPQLTPAAVSRLTATDPAGLQNFRDKVASATAATRLTAAVDVRRATRWDTRAYQPAPNLLVLETTSIPPPQSHLRVTVDGTIPSPAGPVTPVGDAWQTAEMAPAFFGRRFDCVAQCTPSSYNSTTMTVPVRLDHLIAAAAVTRLGPPDVAISRSSRDARAQFLTDTPEGFTLEELGYDAQPPATTYAIRLAPTLEAIDGQTLGYPWTAVVENWHELAVASFGDGHGVWESSGGTQLPFFARNLQEVRQSIAAVARDGLMPTLLSLQKSNFHLLPPGAVQTRRLTVTPDTLQSHGLNINAALNGRSTGLLWAGVESVSPIDRSTSNWNRRTPEQRRRATLVQVTNLGITVKDSPQNTLIFVTRLDNGEPVPEARVSIVRTDNTVFWRGTTNADGIAIAPDTDLRDHRRPWEFAFIVIAEKGDDLAYVGSDWTEGIERWQFHVRSSWGNQPESLLRGTVFTDRGVYRLGEEVHFKAVLRRDTGRSIEMLSASTPVRVLLFDSRNNQIDKRTIQVGDWSSAEWTFKLPASGSLGDYRIQAYLEPDKAASSPSEEEKKRRQRSQEVAAQLGASLAFPEEQQQSIYSSFLVAAYKRPDFRVDATLTGGPAPLAGDTLTGAVTARYLFGASMKERPVKWTTSRRRVLSAPAAVLDKFIPAQWTFVGFDDEEDRNPYQIESLEGDTATLTAGGEFSRAVKTPRDSGWPYQYTFEGDVEDVSRQHIANSASIVVHPAPWYIGVHSIPYFTNQRDGVQTSIVTVTPQGVATPGVKVTVALKQIQWNSVRRAEGGGFYTWETERRLVDVSSQTVTTGVDPAPLTITLPSGGSFMLIATAQDADGRTTKTTSRFYALGTGYTAWSRYDHNRIDLVPEKATYKPGDTARIMIQSPWERATALVTTEREGIRTSRRFALTSTQQTITIPIGEDDIPNVFVSVLLVKGRTAADTPDDASDPGKPSFRLGYVELTVEDAVKRLSVDVTANREEYRPANKGRIDVTLKDAAGRPVVGEVTLWAVDYGVLSLTAFQTPDVLETVYVPKSLEVSTEDNRQRLISRRATIPKGGEDGGGGGESSGAGTLRRDFRVLAFWVGSTITDANGRATADVQLPESLTTYRIMAVAADKSSRFGWGKSEIRINKPVTLLPAFPRFLAVGDRALFGSVVTSQLKTGGSASVTIKSLDPTVLAIDGAATQQQSVAAGGSAEVRFTAMARSVGRARVQMTVRLNGETDAYEDIVPVEILSSPETVAAYGQTQTSANESLRLPANAVPGFGGLTVDLSSTALVNLGEGARYLVEYPYGCAEQRSSRALAMLLTADLGSAFSLPGIEPATLKPTVQTALNELRDYQCATSGGFALWAGECRSVTPYLTSYVLHVLYTAKRLGYVVDDTVTTRAADYLQRQITAAKDPTDDFWPAELAWRTFAVKVLVEGGRNQDSAINRLLPRMDRMPVFGLVYLLDSLGTGASRTRDRDEVMRRINNATFDQAGLTHVEELTDPYLMWFWNSNVRTTAIALNAFVQRGAPNDVGRIRGMVQWLLAARQSGRWNNTQENALVLEALVSYYRKYEATPPSFAATVSLGSRTLARSTFAGRSTESVSRQVPLRELTTPAAAASQTTRPVTFAKKGEGTLFYTARLRYAVNDLTQSLLDNGFAISRTYAPVVDGKAGATGTSFKAGDLVRVTIRLALTQERRYVAVSDPLPAGFEPVESWFATTAADLARAQDQQGDPDANPIVFWWERGGFEHVERHDDRVLLFATRLSEGVHEFSYIVRATTAGTFRTAPAHAEEMYEPEVFGRTATTSIEVRP
jgi:uncharacterized protein YfaS (alpha-2-macroglobulin family)